MIGKTIKRVPTKKFIEHYESAIKNAGRKRTSKTTTGAAATKKRTAKKSSPVKKVVAGKKAATPRAAKKKASRQAPPKARRIARPVRSEDRVRSRSRSPRDAGPCRFWCPPNGPRNSPRFPQLPRLYVSVSIGTQKHHWTRNADFCTLPAEIEHGHAVQRANADE